MAIIENKSTAGFRLQSESSSSGKSGIALPAGSWDTHVHVFDSTIGPFASSRSYTPAQANLRQLLDFSSTLTGNQPLNIVLVQPSPYRNDNTVLLHLLRKLRDDGAKSARGVAVVDIDNTGDEELWSMHQLGVRGLRINMQADGKSTDVAALRSVLERTASRIRTLPGWRIQLFCAAAIWDELFETIYNLPVEVIADHVGGLYGSSKLPSKSDSSVVDCTKQPGFASLVRLAKDSKVIIKVSGLYRLSSQTDTGYDDMEPIIKTLADAVPDRLVWGSDWPHTGEGHDRLKRGRNAIEEFREIDDKSILLNLREWVGSADAWEKMTLINPRKLYG
ncbi:transcriptional family amidohydrolase family protein [Colletotrichum truncatum]|uniref:Transcriptional family amidohydrolase family protein n=1 Tax=Colletotrichum truncatum TaxID=5467 RepID=A0ACC3YWR8_COLTU